jgi:hypothetical protein
VQGNIDCRSARQYGKPSAKKITRNSEGAYPEQLGFYETRTSKAIFDEEYQSQARVNLRGKKLPYNQDQLSDPSSNPSKECTSVSPRIKESMNSPSLQFNTVTGEEQSIDDILLAEGIAFSILGQLVYSPTVTTLLRLQGTEMHVLEWEAVKWVLESNIRARKDISVLARGLQERVLGED